MCNGKALQINSIVLVANEYKPRALEALDPIKEQFQKQGIAADAFVLKQIDQIPFEKYQAIVSIGGDGTLLQLASYALNANKPIIGVNCGHMGFLTMYTPESLTEHILSLKKGLYGYSKRHLLEAQCADGWKFQALNDIVIKSSILRLVDLKIYLPNNTLVSHTRSDGMIFATSTGSTAYNLSAHGPVLHPETNTWCMTPICPHDFFNRSLVFDASVQIVVHTHSKIDLVIDGKKLENKHNLPLRIGTAKKTLTLITPQSFSFFQNLRTKFNW